MIKILSKLGIEGIYLKIIKAVDDKPTTNILNRFFCFFFFSPLRAGKRVNTGIRSDHLLYKVVLEVLAKAITQEK